MESPIANNSPTSPPPSLNASITTSPSNSNHTNPSNNSSQSKNIENNIPFNIVSSPNRNLIKTHAFAPDKSSPFQSPQAHEIYRSTLSPPSFDLNSKNNSVSNSPGFSPIPRSPRHSTHVPYLNEILSNKLYNKRASISSPLSTPLSSTPTNTPKLSTSSFSPNPHFIPPSMSRDKVAQTPSKPSSRVPNTIRSNLKSPVLATASPTPLSRQYTKSSKLDYNYDVTNHTMPQQSPNTSMAAESTEPQNRTWSQGSDLHHSGTFGIPGTSKSDSLIAKHRQTIEIYQMAEYLCLPFTRWKFDSTNDILTRILKSSNCAKEVKRTQKKLYLSVCQDVRNECGDMDIREEVRGRALSNVLIYITALQADLRLSATKILRKGDTHVALVSDAVTGKLYYIKGYSRIRSVVEFESILPFPPFSLYLFPFPSFFPLGTFDLKDIQDFADEKPARAIKLACSGDGSYMAARDGFLYLLYFVDLLISI
jgi:hypothetical protein